MKTNRIIRWLGVFAVLFFTFVLSGCADYKNESVLMLDSNWEYSIIEPQDDININFYPLEMDKMTELDRFVPGRKGYIWIKNTFTVPPEFRGKDLAVYYGRISIADETRVNNIHIGGEGLFPPHLFSAWNVIRTYHIPKEILNYDGPNYLVTRIYTEGEGSVSTVPFISLPEYVEDKADFEKFWNSKMYILFAFFMILVAVYNFVLYSNRRKENEYITFGIINILSALYMTVFCLGEIPGIKNSGISFLWYQKIFSSALPFCFPFMVNGFINSFLKRRESKIVFVLRCVFAIIPIAMILCAPDYIALKKLNGWIMLLLLPPMLYILYIAIGSVVKHRKDSIVLLIGFSPLVICVVLDTILHNLLKLENVPYFTSLGWQLAIIALMFILAKRFTAALNESEYLNQHLENEVNSRTRELSESNEKLTCLNEELESAKDRADRDMKLAVYVQQSFYQHRLPELKDWDLAYYFKPMAGVSGDMYDFFEEDGKLCGVGLFDVSGHGIASGLVTMLAKTVVDRKFIEGKSQPLGKVMGDINDTIVQEKGDIENYLTGVLLRLNGSKIEYINAGHPKSFCRVGKTGKVMPIELKGGESGSSGIIGIAGMLSEFKVIGFGLNKGDAIILYTDCLSESRNAAGEEYTQDRVAESFGRSGNGSANDKLNHVLNEFNQFVQGVPLNDDLTVIVLQKK